MSDRWQPRVDNPFALADGGDGHAVLDDFDLPILNQALQLHGSLRGPDEGGQRLSGGSRKAEHRQIIETF